jgi:hypothetical protein
MKLAKLLGTMEPTWTSAGCPRGWGLISSGYRKQGGLTAGARNRCIAITANYIASW